MLRPKTFGILVAALLVLIGWGCPIPDRDPFSGLTTGEGIDLDRLSVMEMTYVKLGHAATQPPYTVGLFGNSRSVEVAAEELGYAPEIFFNFSVPGASLRGTAAMLESLAGMGKLPATVVISFDHSETQYFGNPDFPTLPGRWRRAVEDMTAVLAHDNLPVLDWISMAKRHLQNEFALFKESYHFETFRKRASFLLDADPWERFSTAPAAGSHGNRYARDGSRRSGSHGEHRESPPIMPPSAKRVLNGYLDLDLERLARLRRHCRRMVIYESPLAPSSARYYAQSPTPRGRATLALLRQRCPQLGLVFVPADADNPLFATAKWTDNSHAPAEVLAQYIRETLDTATS